MVKEYGPTVFKEGCPVCLELCCCSNKSYLCSRVNHCYRKCPASKAKCGGGNEDKTIKLQAGFAVPPGKLVPPPNFDEGDEDICTDHEAAAVALCSLISASQNVSPKTAQKVLGDSSGDSVSEEEVKIPNRPFKKRTVSSLDQGEKNAKRGLMPQVKKARELKQNCQDTFSSKASTTAQPSMPNSSLSDYSYPYIPHAHSVMFQQYPLYYQLGGPNTFIVNATNTEENRPGVEMHGNEFSIAYPYAYQFHVPGSDIALPSKILLSHPAYSGYTLSSSTTLPYTVDKNYMLFSNTFSEKLSE